MLPITFGHLTDLHLPIRTTPPVSALLGKGALGYLSWLRRRRRWHKPHVIEALIGDLRKRGCRAVLISGDVVNIAAPREFADASDWINNHFNGLPVTFAPGNHDAYVARPWSAHLGALDRYMTGSRAGDRGLRAPRSQDDFPFTASPGGVDEIAVIVANSSPPTAPGLATGAIGPEQLRRIETELEAARARGAFRILMLHHPINDGVVSRRKALVDRGALVETIGRAGVELVLHGHAHIAHLNTVATPTGDAPVVGGASASHPRAAGKYRPGRCNLFELTKEASVWSLGMTVKEFDPASNSVKTVEQRRFERPAQTAAKRESAR